MSTKVETLFVLNHNEIGILLSALQLLTLRDETLIEREHGSARVLYERLHECYVQYDSFDDNQPYCGDASY